MSLPKKHIIINLENTWYEQSIRYETKCGRTLYDYNRFLEVPKCKICYRSENKK